MIAAAAIPPAKRAILAEALTLFATRGVEAVSVRDIAAATGYSNPALFRHFAGKDELACHLFTQCYGDLVAALDGVPAEAGLAGWLMAALEHIAAEPQAVHFVLENLRHYWARLPDQLRSQNLPALVRAMLVAEQQAGRIRADLDPALAATVLLGTLGQLARAAHFAEHPLDPAMTAAALAELLQRGFAA